MAFDKEGWAAERGNADGENRRIGMVSDLDDAGVKPGATRDGVRALLGEPDGTDPDADVYFLGRSRSGPSYESLRIEYTAQGIVAGTQVRRT